MFTAQQYVKATSVQQALELNQKRSNAILGGGCWMRLGHKSYSTLIDLSALGLDKIEETENEITIGAMVTLRQLETSDILKKQFGCFFEEMTRHIVGVQFRNCATVGGSIASRFGFSDILTGMLALECEVELASRGRITLDEYAALPYDRDILLNIIIKKDGRKAAYQSMRNSETDLPVLACAVSVLDGSARLVVGARPQKAVVYKADLADCGSVITQIQNTTAFGSNMRAGKDYRRMLCGVLLRRALDSVKEDS